MKFVGGQWIKPKYKIEHKQVFIPTMEETQLVLNSGRKDNMIFSLFLYETGARKNEAERLLWIDLCVERNQVRVKASKHGKERTITISKKLMDQLFSLPKNTDTVFPKKSKHARQTAFRYRIKNLARKHQNPRLLKIHFHTFRHLKALQEYDKTKSVLHVMKVLGHKSIMTTQRYVDLYTEIYGDLKPEKCI